VSTAYGSRLYQICKCSDNLARIQYYLSNPQETTDPPITILLGQMDQWEELHRLLYEEEPDDSVAQRNSSNP